MENLATWVNSCQELGEGKKATVPCYLHVGLNCCTKFHVTPIAFVWKTIRMKLTSSGWMRINQHASTSAVAAKQMWLKQSKFTGIILPCQRSAWDIERCYIVSCQCMLTAALTKKRDASSKKATPPREGSESREKKEKEKHNESNSGRSTLAGNHMAHLWVNEMQPVWNRHVIS